MAIHVNTDDSQGLLDSIYAAIDEGSIETWAYDDDMDFFHDTADGQWKGEAWLHPTVGKGVLVLNPCAHVALCAYQPKMTPVCHPFQSWQRA